MICLEFYGFCRNLAEIPARLGKKKTWKKADNELYQIKSLVREHSWHCTRSGHFCWLLLDLKRFTVALFSSANPCGLFPVDCFLVFLFYRFRAEQFLCFSASTVVLTAFPLLHTRFLSVPGFCWIGPLCFEVFQWQVLPERVVLVFAECALSRLFSRFASGCSETLNVSVHGMQHYSLVRNFPCSVIVILCIL